MASEQGPQLLGGFKKVPGGAVGWSAADRFTLSNRHISTFSADDIHLAEALLRVSNVGREDTRDLSPLPAS